MKLILKATALIFLAAFLSPVAQEGKLFFKLDLTPQSHYLSAIDMNQTITQTIDNSRQVLKQEMLMVWQYDVMDRDSDGNTHVQMTYRRVKMNQDFGQQKAEYDSDNPPEFLDPSMKGMASLVGAELDMAISPGGRILNLGGVDDLLNKMIEAMGLPENPEKEIVIRDLKRQFGEDALKQSIEQATGFYPEKPVGLGESWTNEINLSSGFPMQIISNYTLKSRQDGQATIDFTSQIKSDSSIGSMKMGPLTMVYNITGSQTGAILADEATGLPLSSKSKLQFSGTVTVSGVPDEPSQSWPISAEGIVEMGFKGM